MKLKSILFTSFLLTTSSFAINCKDFGGEFLTHNGHYYAITGNKMTFETARQYATANGGYLAIPNTAAENDFIKGIVGANNEAWLGIYDPNYSQNFCMTNDCFSTNRTRFVTTTGAALTYQNWDPNDVENKLMQGDDAVDLYNNRIIQTLGEPYTIISGTTGLWRDWGTHFISGDNPVTMQGVIEFDSKPTCYEAPSGVTDDVVNKCNTQIWSDTIGMSAGETLDCRTDQYGTNYCPSALALAGKYWDYENGYSVAHNSTVIDNVNSVYTERTGTVRDFANGTSQPNTSTTTNYSNGTSASYTGSVVDYVNKTTTTVIINNGYSSCSATMYFSGSSMDCSGSVGSNCLAWGSWGQNCALPNKVGGFVQPGTCAISPYNGANQCNNSIANTTTTTSTTCPTGYTDNGSNCKKTVNYNYYSYGCPSGYSPNNSGFSTYTKTDPDTTANNEATLDDAVNSSTPPANNCVQTLTATAYQYICGTGYTPINAGLTSCPAGMNGACNSSTSPTSNCWKDINYKYYEYGCDSGYSTNNHGFTTFTKTDPDATVNNEATLDDAVNSATAPDGNCQKPVSYTYYEYLCSNSTNAQGQNYSATNTGMTTCTKTDTSTTTDNSATLDDSCNSSTPPTNNCKREGFTCNSTDIKPAYINSSWQCSPFPCLSNDNFENAGSVMGANDKNNNGWSNDGNCAGQIYIFGGKDYRCRASDKLLGLSGGGCCDKDKVALGLVSCKDNEKMLAKKRQAEQCHKVGTYCSKKIKLGVTKVCVQDSDSYCCFNGKLARIIHEQGRPQIGLSWGSSDAPNCRGFKPEEFQKLDLSKIDFSEAFADIKVNATNITTVTTNLRNKVNNIQVPK